MSTVISVENVSKSYRLGSIGGATLKEDFARWWAKLRKKPDPLARVGEEVSVRHNGGEFWALRDVNFQVREGEVLGGIGRNGAGKSTLLKILSQVTSPSSGEIKIKGRIASLLEVGTGFHPELTGRENVFLNGAILGMTKVEIRKKFDEIVAFSGIEEFIDTPVKRYSSGMYVRLAFAVAAHLEPEILIVDEVLAVGDAEFQKKCMGKMHDVSQTGRTILFVSHNMAAVSKLCNQSILMDAGQVRLSGPTNEVLPHYLKIGTQSEGIRTWENFDNDVIKVHALRILAPGGGVTGHIDIRHSFSIEVTYTVLQVIPRFRIGLRLLTADGTIAFTTSESVHPSFESRPHAPGVYATCCQISGNLLNEGLYSLDLSADIPFQKVLFIEEGAVGFAVEQTDSAYTKYPEKWPGVICPRLEWMTKRVEKSIYP